MRISTRLFNCESFSKDLLEDNEFLESFQNQKVLDDKGNVIGKIMYVKIVDGFVEGNISLNENYVIIDDSIKSKGE